MHRFAAVRFCSSSQLAVRHSKHEQTTFSRSDGFVNFVVKRWWWSNQSTTGSQRTPFFWLFLFSVSLCNDGVLSTHISRSAEREIDLQVALSRGFVMIGRLQLKWRHQMMLEESWTLHTLWKGASWFKRKSLNYTSKKKCSDGVSPSNWDLSPLGMLDQKTCYVAFGCKSWYYWLRGFMRQRTC